MAEAVFSEDVPTMTRSGFMKSETASPSLRNSGFDTTSKAMSSLYFRVRTTCTRR